MNKVSAAIASLQSLSTASTNEVTKALGVIQTDLNKTIMESLSHDEILFKLKNIWQVLLNASASETSSIRLSAYRATGAFLTRITPYFPDEVCSTFSDIALASTIDIQSSAVIAASFAYLTKFIAPHLLDKFTKSTPVFHHFSFVDPSFAEHLAQIISNIDHLGNQWLKILLHSFLEKIETQKQRHLFRSVASIVEHNVPYFFTEIISFLIEQDTDNLKENRKILRKSISLLSFLVNQLGSKCEKCDLHDTALAALDALKEPDASPVLLDEVMQILAAKSPSFSVKIEVLDDSFVFTIDNDSVKVEKKKLNNRPALYKLDLPLNILIPTEDDGAFVLAAKLNALGVYASGGQDIRKVFDILIKFAECDRADLQSAAFSGLSYCANNAVMCLDSKIIAQPICKIILTKYRSWYQCLGALSIFKAIRPSAFIKKIGKGVFDDLVKYIIELCFSENESLHKEAMNTLCYATYEDNFEFVMTSIIDRIESLNPSSLRKGLETLVNVIDEKPVPSNQIQWFVYSIVESVPYFNDDMSVLSAIFNFLSSLEFTENETEMLRPISAECLGIVEAYVSAVSGSPLPQSALKIRDLVNEELSSRTTDIVAESTEDLLQFLSPFRSALKFALKLPSGLVSPQKAMQLATSTFPLFPSEITKYIIKNASKLEKDASDFISNVHTRLRFVSNTEVHATWCAIIAHYENNDSPEFEENRNFLLSCAEFYLTKSNRIDPSIVAPFSLILHMFKPEDDKIISDILQSMSLIELQTFLRHLNQMSVDDYKLMQNAFPALENVALGRATPKRVKERRRLTRGSDISNDGFLTEIQVGFERYVVRGKIAKLKTVLENAAEASVFPDTAGIVIPHSVESVVCDWFTKNHPRISDPSEALDKVRTAMRNEAILVLKKKADEAVDFIAKKDRIKKKDLMNIESIIGIADFDKAKVAEICLKIAKNPETESRRATAYRLLASMVEHGFRPDTHMIDSLLESIDEAVEEDSDEFLPYTAAECLSAFCRRCGSEDRCYETAKKLARGIEPKGKLAALISMVAIAGENLSMSKSQQTFMMEAAEATIKANIPSVILTGLRMIDCGFARLSKPRLEALAKLTVEGIIKLIHTDYKLLRPAACACIKELLARENPLASASVEKYYSSVFEIPSDPFFADSVGLIKLMLRQFNKENRRALKERMKELLNSDDLSVFKVVISTIASHSKQKDIDKRGYIAQQYSACVQRFDWERMAEWHKILEDLHPGVAVTIWLEFLERAPAFYLVFPDLARFYKRHSTDEKVIEAVSNTMMMDDHMMQAINDLVAGKMKSSLDAAFSAWVEPPEEEDKAEEEKESDKGNEDKSEKEEADSVKQSADSKEESSSGEKPQLARAISPSFLEMMEKIKIPKLKV